MPAQESELNYQVRTKTGEVFGQLTAACPHRGASHSLIRVTWTIRFGLSQARDSSQQHARHRKVNWTIRFGLRQGRYSDSSQHRARTGGGQFSPTCDLDYQVRTKSGEGQLTAACPRRGVNWTIRFGLSQGRSSDSSQQHARGRQILSYVWLGLSGSD